MNDDKGFRVGDVTFWALLTYHGKFTEQNLVTQYDALKYFSLGFLYATVPLDVNH